MTSILQRFFCNTAWQILFALFFGIFAGAAMHYISFPDSEYYSYYSFAIVNIFRPAGTIFIQLIKMIVLPIILSTLILGIAGLGSSKRFGSLGFKTILYFEIITTSAIFLGMLFANVFHPGAGINTTDLMKVNTDSYISQTKVITKEGHQAEGLIAMILNMIPANVFTAMGSGDVLPVIFFCVFFGLGLTKLPEHQRLPFLNYLKVISDTMFNVTNMVMRYAPVGVFALITVTVASYGLNSLMPLLKLVVIVYISMIIFTVGILGLVCKLCGFNIFTLLKILKEDLIIAFSTSSSETALI